MVKKIRMAIVGAGTWGENHARLYQEHPFCEVVAICDLNLKRARESASRLGIDKVFDDYVTMLNEVDCDAVAIVTPDFAHTEPALCAASYKKHLLIEKPIATKKEEIIQIMRAVKDNGVRAMVDLHNRWSPPFNRAAQAIEQGILGQVYSGYYRMNDAKWVATDMLSWAAESSILWFLGTHSIDTLNWLFNSKVRRVYSVSREGILKGMGIDTVDEYLTTLEYENGCVAQMENGWITPNANPCVNDIKCNILGTKGMIEIDASNHSLIQLYTDEKVVVPDMMVQNRIFGAPKGFAFESIRSFVDCLISGEEFHVSLEAAAQASFVVLAILESAKHRQPVEVNYYGIC